MLTIVMYHYIRDLPRSRYPRIKALQTERFDRQLDYICKHYTVCSLLQVAAAARGAAELPTRPCLLTFDDGFVDHHCTVLPRLLARRITGSFFPTARPVLERRVLDVHKLHFVLASAAETQRLTKNVLTLVAAYRTPFDLPDDETLYQTYAGASRFDPAEIIFIKRLLQHGLPAAVRSEILSSLFAQYVTADDRAFADELYMSLPQLRELSAAGMEVGGHGYAHCWLEHLPQAEQAEEISRTLDFLRQIGGGTPSDWVMCYPFGSYNATTLDLLRQNACAIGLTTHVGLNSDLSRPLELRRLDANDLPCDADAEPCDWTRQVYQADGGGAG